VGHHRLQQLQESSKAHYSLSIHTASPGSFYIDAKHHALADLDVTPYGYAGPFPDTVAYSDGFPVTHPYLYRAPIRYTITFAHLATVPSAHSGDPPHC
jgi:hypothetical protein